MFSPGQKIRIRSSARSDTGRVRDNNEDRVHLSSFENMVLAVVADGMGGAVAGEEASRIAVETIEADIVKSADAMRDTYGKIDDETLADQMRTVIVDANNSIVQRAQKQPELKGMGTTVTMAFIRNTHVVLGHVGDSRAYLIDGESGQIVQITSDHSFVQALVTAGHISAEEAEDHPMRNVLYRALGQAHDIEVDIYYERLRIGDRMVLCSDGLTLHVKPEEIAQVVLAAENPDESSQKLIDLANSRGGRDNVSAIVIKVERDPAGETRILNKAQVEPDDDYDFDNEDTLIITRENKNAKFESSESPTVPRPGEAESATTPTVTAATPEKLTTAEVQQQHINMQESMIRSNETNSDSAGEGTDPRRNSQ